MHSDPVNCQAETLRRGPAAGPDRPYCTARITPVHDLEITNLPYLDSASAPLEERVIRALSITAATRPRWRQHGVECDPLDVHAAQLAWYDHQPDLVELTLHRHGATMQALGLLSGTR